MSPVERRRLRGRNRNASTTCQILGRSSTWQSAELGVANFEISSTYFGPLPSALAPDRMFVRA